MADKELQRLRAELRKRRNAATAKIGRIQKSIGINLANTAYDPRPNPETIGRYNKVQLRAQIRKVDNFTSRETAFVPGAGGVPLPRSEWDKYKAAEAKVGLRAATEFDKVADIFIPHLGVTVGQRERYNRADRPRGRGEAASRSFPVYARESTDITSAESLRKLTADMNKRLDRRYLPERIASQRVQLDEMLKVIGDDKYREQANQLSDHQFNVLWNYEDLAHRISERYAIVKLMAAGRKDRQFQSQLDTNEEILDEIFTMAASLPRKAPRKTGRR